MILRHPITRYNFTCNTLQHTATHCMQHSGRESITRCNFTRRNTLKHIATRCNTLQHTATHCNTLRRSATASSRECIMHYNFTPCNALQHTTTHRNTLQLQLVGNSSLTATSFPATLLPTAHCDSLRRTTTHCNTFQLLWLQAYMTERAR